MADKNANSIPAKDIQALLQQLALSSSDAPKKEGKAPEDYKFWTTQPVPQFPEADLLQTTAEGDLATEGPILSKEVCDAIGKPQPERLIDGFVWDSISLDDDKEMQELYDLLYNHYVEDIEGSFRFDYSRPFLTWALTPPGWQADWHVGVRTKPNAEGKKGKLVAFISAVPATLRLRDNKLPSVEINFLIVHRKLRAKRLTPVLIKEITRRCYNNGLYQALYTAGALLPTPVSTCRYFHRSLDWPHLYKHGFSAMPPRSSEQQQVRKYWLPSRPETKGLRAMKQSDVPAVKDLLTRYLERFQLRQVWSDEEIEHYLCSAASKGVVWSYVVEQEGKITDFFSFYLLESTVLKANKKESIRAGYLYYYATEAAFTTPPTEGKGKATEDAGQKHLATRLNELIRAALILAKKENFHVFNALTLLDNPLFLKENKFEPGDGRLHFYLFNWRAARIPGGIDGNNQIDANRMGGIGIVLL